MSLGIAGEDDGEGDTKYNLGDSLDFTLRVALPPADEAPLSVLISGTSPADNTSSVMFCSPTLKKIVRICDMSQHINNNVCQAHIAIAKQ